MTEIDFDELKSLRGVLPSSWRESEHSSSANCDVVINDGNKYSIHLQVACCSSVFFYNVATGSKLLESHKQLSAGVHTSTGEIHIKSRDGATIKIGQVAGTLQDLKKQVQLAHEIPECQQRFFVRNGQKGDEELDEDWRTLRSYGVKKEDTLNLLVREPWQRTDLASKTVNLTLPEPCASVFEWVLDYMYDDCVRRESSSVVADLAPDRVLAALWLAGRLEMARLQLLLVQHLQRAVTPANAHAYMSAALGLGLGKVWEVAARLVAAAGLDRLPRGACDGMPLDAVERLVAMAAAAAGEGAAAGRDRVLASYLRARDAAGRLDEESYRRLMRSHSAGNVGVGGGVVGDGISAQGDNDANDGDDEDEDEDEDGVEAEDVLLLLDLALRFGDARLERRWVRRAAAGFAGVRTEDLGRLPGRVVAGLLGDDGLAVETEDDVHRAVAAYLAAREARGAPAPEAERRALWGCCRFAYCSAGVQAELAGLAEAAEGLGQEFLWGVVAERMRREGGEAGEREAARGLGAGAVGSAQGRARRKAARAQVRALLIRYSDNLCSALLAAALAAAPLPRHPPPNQTSLSQRTAHHVSFIDLPPCARG